MQKTTTFAQKQLNKNLGDIKGPRYIVLLLYIIVAVESKGLKEKKKPHSGEVDIKSYPIMEVLLIVNLKVNQVTNGSFRLVKKMIKL